MFNSYPTEDQLSLLPSIPPDSNEEWSDISRKRVARWLAIGNANPWITRAVDPPFDVDSFEVCEDVRYFMERVLKGNWCLGQAFAHQDLCVINQIDGGDEWLTIKNMKPFESITFQTPRETREEAQERFRKFLSDVLER